MMNKTLTLTDTGYDSNATEATRRRYQRNARFYDLMEGGTEKRHGPWREQLWPIVKGSKALEVRLSFVRSLTLYSVSKRSGAC